MSRLLLIIAALFLPVRAMAEEPLRLEDVLQSSARHSPAIVEAINREQVAEGRRLSASGAFDTVFDLKAQSRVLGYYDGSTFDGLVTRPLTGNGGNVYAGYRVSTGNFPGYYGGNYTNQLGEARVGTVFSLMRDRLVDERRTRLSLAARDVELARLDRELVAIGIQRRAIAAYQQWVAAGLRVEIYRDLLALATQRQASISRQIKLGARPAILSTENEQNIVRRRSLLVRAEQDLDTAAIALSFYLRDDAGGLVVPGRERLPSGLPELRLPDLANGVGRNTIRDFDRPEIATILVRLEKTRDQQRLAENDYGPRLDLQAEVSKDIGPIGPGGISRDPAEAFVGLRLTLPFERRHARGRMDEARAEADALQARRRMLEDQILLEVNGLALQVAASERLVALAGDETRLANDMAEAERRRFTLGASDFLVVNLREESAADARLRQIDAEYRRSSARAELVAATVDRDQLSL